MAIRIWATPAGRVTLCITIPGCVAERKTLGDRRDGRWRRGASVINMYKMPRLSFLANLNDQYCTALCFKQRDKSRSCLYCLELHVDKVFMSACVSCFRSGKTFIVKSINRKSCLIICEFIVFKYNYMFLMSCFSSLLVYFSTTKSYVKHFWVHMFIRSYERNDDKQNRGR